MEGAEGEGPQYHRSVTSTIGKWRHTSPFVAWRLRQLGGGEVKSHLRNPYGSLFIPDKTEPHGWSLAGNRSQLLCQNGAHPFCLRIGWSVSP